MLDLSNTGITRFGICWFDNARTVKVPKCFKSVTDRTCSGVTIDYTNVTEGDEYLGSMPRAVNTNNFRGYKTIKILSDPLLILGENTNTLWFGVTSGEIKNSDLNSLNFGSVISKAPNIKELRLCRVSGMTDIYVLNDLGLKTLEIMNTPIYKEMMFLILLVRI